MSLIDFIKKSISNICAKYIEGTLDEEKEILPIFYVAGSQTLPPPLTAEEEEETPEETAEEVLEDMAHEEDAEDEVKWAEKVICNFGVYAGTPLGEMMQDARGYQTIKWLVQRYKGQNQEIQKAAKILLDHEKEMQKAA